MDEYTQLRTLLLGEEQRQLQHLQSRLDDTQQRSQEVAQVLPSALRNVPDPAELVTALQVPVDSCVKQSVQQDPRPFVKAMLPIMGPLLRKNLADALKSLREFLQTQQIQLDEVDKRIATLEQFPFQEWADRFVQLEKAISDISDLERRVQETARILPEAIRQATSELPPPVAADQPQEDNLHQELTELTDSLQVPVEQCIKQSVNQNTQAFADALFPVMGPAIRKSINEAFKAVLHSINKNIEQSLSRRGLAWRFESLRTGRPFSEIVLRETLVYRVEQTFLIHRESGLLIEHLNQEGVETGDSEAVSAMLTAIQDFIRDSFSKSKKEELDTVEIGEYIVWLERGPYAVLACVIRGIPPLEFRNTMRGLLESIHARYGRLLERFSGDSVSLNSCIPLLQRTLQSELKADEISRGKRLFSPMFFLLLVTLLLLVGWWGYRYIEFQSRLSQYAQALHATPGIVVVEQQGDYNKLIIRGLRDPLAEDPLRIARKFDLNPENIVGSWSPYQDLSHSFVEQRLNQWLKPPQTVQWLLQGDVLYISGHAQPQWIDKAVNVAGAVAGVNQVNTDGLVETDRFLLDYAHQKLMPPSHITLSVKSGILKITGFADANTRAQLPQQLSNLQGFVEIDTSNLRDIDRETRQRLVQRVEKSYIYFSEDAELVPGQEARLQALLEDMQQLLALSQYLSESVHIQITGYTDGLGTRAHNQILSQQRAELMKKFLVDNGIAPGNLAIMFPPIIRFDEKEPSFPDRKVGFRVTS